jgi:ATP-dependent helicase/nuclease subunit A
VLANLSALLGVSLQLGGGRYATPYALVRALKAGGVQAPAAVVQGAVRLLTIHGAKGLEAHTVLLLDTDTAPRKADTMGVLVDWPGESARPRKFVFLASESHPPACAVQTLAVETTERQREELNALYVALTRARHTLAISSITPHREAEHSWWARLSGLADDVEDGAGNVTGDVTRGVTGGVTGGALPLGTAACVPVLEAVPGAAEVPATGRFFIKELPAASVGIEYEAIKEVALFADIDAIQDATPDSAPDPASVSASDPALGSTSARRGQAMHRLLEWGSAGAANIRAAMREFDLTPEQGSEAADMARRILAGEGAWAWDTALVGWQGNEVALNYLGDTLRLDRLVQRRDTGEWWVLDYKSPHAPQDDPALVNQLQNYRDAVRVIYPEAAVRAAFLTGSGKLVEPGIQ